MTKASAPYLAWARSRPAPEVDLAGSNLLAASLADLPGAREAVDLTGESPEGYRPLVEAIAAAARVDPSRVATAGGCSGANFIALQALLDPGDEVLLESPGYDPIEAAAVMAGALVRRFERRFEDGWAVDPDRVAAALTPRTKAIAITSPHNPSGSLVAGDGLAALERLARERGLRVLVDEVYADTLAGDPYPPRPAAVRSDVFVSTTSLTKAYGLAALRCGWAIASGEVAAEMRRVRGLVDGSGPIPSERLAEVALRNLPALRRRALAILEPNRRLWAEFLASRPELECSPSPTVSSIAFPRFRDGRDAAGFAERLFARTRVAVAPGAFFAPGASTASHFRVSLGGATDALREGLSRMSSALDFEPREETS
jgi:aspartate/methionine/tyrosine aminotransferase